MVTNNGWILFDYVNATNFKFAGVDATADLWIIGDVINGTKTNRATFAQTLNTNTSYPVKILLEGSTATLINSNAIKVRYAFSSLTARPVALGMRGSATCDFDNILIYTETFPTGTVSNPPAIPAPTSSSGAPDLATESYDSPAFYYNLNDHLGTTRIVTNSAGVVTGSFEDYPFGEVKSSTGCPASNQRFTGKLFDNESGLQYFGARYLSNDLTRFTSIDPASASFNPLDPQSWNRYAYSLNDPINLRDPDGRCSSPALGQGQVGICVDLYIASNVLPTAVPLGVAFGDGRGPAQDDSEATYRAELQFVVDTSNMSLTKVKDDAGVSIANVAGVTFAGKGKSTTTVSDPKTDVAGSMHFSVSNIATNGLSSKPTAPKDTIKTSLNFVVTKEGLVGLDSGGSRTAYPSIEIYSYKPGGRVGSIYQRKESGRVDDLKRQDQAIPAVQPR